jgi:Protein of unknown function (DUF4232)
MPSSIQRAPVLTRVIVGTAIAITGFSTAGFSCTASNASATSKFPICENGQLKYKETSPKVGISQYVAESFRITNIGGSTCTLNGFPTVTFDVESPKNTYHAATGVRTLAGPSKFYKTEKARLVAIEVHGTASFGLSFTTAYASKDDDAMGCTVLEQILVPPFAKVRTTSGISSPATVGSEVSNHFNICRADRTVYVTPVEPGSSPQRR